MADSFIFRREWIENISQLDPVIQDQIISDLARYGVGLEMQHINNPVVSSFVESQKEKNRWIQRSLRRESRYE